MFNYSKEYLIDNNHHLIMFDIDNNKIITTKKEFKYDYGLVKTIS